VRPRTFECSENGLFFCRLEKKGFGEILVFLGLGKTKRIFVEVVLEATECSVKRFSCSSPRFRYFCFVFFSCFLFFQLSSFNSCLGCVICGFFLFSFCFSNQLFRAFQVPHFFFFFLFLNVFFPLIEERNSIRCRGTNKT